MKKRIYPFLILSISVAALFFSSCQETVIDPYAYNVDNDTLAPEIQISVPGIGQTYAYGDDVAVVGTVTDKESVKNDNLDPGFRPGQLKTLSITVENMTAGGLLLNKTPDVDGLDGIAFNEKFGIIAGTGTTECRLIVVTSDYGGAVDRDTVTFQYQ